MKRRSFGKLAALGIGAGMISCVSKNKLQSELVLPDRMSKILAPGLKKGDTIGLIAPGSAFSKELYEKATSHLLNMGFKIKQSKNLFANYGYLAGTDRQRIEDIHSMFADPEVNGIWCVRGGYGTGRLLPFLDYQLIRENPKVLVGYSDITTLIQAIQVKTGLVAFHGPVAGSKMTSYTQKNVLQMIMGTQGNHIIGLFDHKEKPKEYTPRVLVSGKMEGELQGGNLSLLSALAGSDFQIDATDKLLFIEETGEKPYRVDRMLTQLRQSANLDKAKGILLGVFANCDQGGEDNSLTLQQSLHLNLADLGIPVYYGFSFGHIDNMCTMPVGVKASFDTSTEELLIKEACIS